MEDTQKLFYKEIKEGQKKRRKESRGKEWKSELNIKNMSCLEGRRDKEEVYWKLKQLSSNEDKCLG